MTLKLQKFFLFLAYAVPLILIIGRAPADITVDFIALVFLVRSAIIRDFSWLRTPWFKLAIITWLYLILDGGLAMYDVKIAVQRALEWIRFPLFAMAFATWLLPLDPGFKILRRSLVTLLSFVAIDALIQFVTGYDVFGFARTTYMGRLTGPFGKDNMVVGLFLLRLVWPTTGLIFAAMLQDHRENKKYLLVPLLFMLLIGVTTLVSGERMSFLLFILSAGIFSLGAKGIRKAVFAAGSFFLIIAVLLVLLRPDLHNRFVTFTKPAVENFEQSSYGVIFSNAITAWKLSPVIGVGPRNFFVACTVNGVKGGFRDEATWDYRFSCARHPHNPYLEWLAETGLIGLGLFLGLIGMWLAIIRRNLKTDNLPCYYIALGFAAGLIPFLWPIMAATSFFINWSAILFWWVLGLNTGLEKKTITKQLQETR